MSAHENSQLLELGSPSGSWAASIGLVGATLIELSYRGQALVVPAHTDMFNTFAGHTLAPWPNRLEDGQWQLGEYQFQAPINELPRNTALHGLVHDRAFQVVSQNQHAVTLSYLLGSDACYPFRIEVLVTYTLTDAGLRVDFGALSQQPSGTEAVPFGIAAHPYFAVDAASELTLPAEKVAEVNNRLLPSGVAELAAIGMHHGTPASVSSLSLDHCFTHLSPGPDGLIATQLSRPELGGTVSLWQQASFGYLMVFTQLGELTNTPGAPIALEPQSCPANALRSGDSLVWLEPGESWSAAWGISFEEEQ